MLLLRVKAYLVNPMDIRTIQTLNKINADFYTTIANDFDETRGKAWAGWEMLMNHIPTPTAPYRVLDIGCGNGRFGVFLHEKWGDKLVYHGIDNNPSLLESAKEALSAKSITFSLQRDDIVMGYTQFEPAYDLVVSFGVIHHIPSAQLRTHLLWNWANAVNAGGYLAFACWRFYEFDRFRDRVTAWDEQLADKVESNDYLLDWRRGKTALRYCHYVDDVEHETLVRATKMTEIATYRADGFTNTVNRYSILKKIIP
jgi:trans-aconitate methyltransferase